MYNISESESYQSVKNFRHTEDMPSIAYAQKQSQCDKSTGMTDFINTIECRLKGAFFNIKMFYLLSYDRADGYLC